MSLAERALTCYERFQLSLSSGSDPSDILVREWKALEGLVGKQATAMDTTTRLAIARIANNVVHQGRATIVAEEVMNRELDDLSVKLDSLIVRDVCSRTFKRKLDTSRPTSVYPTTKRQCRPSTNASHPSHQSHQSIKSITSLQPPSIEELDPVRQFFLENISYPYPTPSQKDHLCSIANITRRKLESDLTNWRRRSEWTEMMNLYCHGDKGLMKRLVEDIESGVEVDEEIKERYGRMKGYLEKKDEQPGDWVYELAAKIQNGELDTQLQARQAQSEIDNMRFVEVEIDSEGLEAFSDSDASPNSNNDHDHDADADTGGDAGGDVDAEGESEPSSPPPSSSSEIVYAPQTHRHESSDSESGSSVSPTPTPKKINKKNKNKAPITLGSPIQEPQVRAQQAQAGVDGTRARAPKWSTTSVPSDLFTSVPLISTTKRPASTKSSYSSLSAVSNLAQSHSRSTSGSTSLRSISSSSSNTNPSSTTSFALGGSGIPIDPRLAHLKRPAQAESFARSSRARVEDILSENENETDDQEPQWLLGYPLPPSDGGFHIGAPPPPAGSHTISHSMSLPYIPYDQSGTGTGTGYNGDLTPYMMVPDVWSTHSTFAYLPHISNLQPTPGAGMGMDVGAGMGVGVGYGSFDLPPEYDFTFNHEPTSAK